MPAIAYRILQGLTCLRPQVPRCRDAILTRTLTPRQAEAFLALSSYDQAHLCRTFGALVTAGAARPDLLAAGLLHDLGKTDGKSRVRFLHRVARVFLQRLAPRLLVRLARMPAPRWRQGFALAVHHPRLGAERAAALDCSPRTCWLIAHHETNPAPDDPDLQLLMAADHAAR